jgi:hypothetical protein
MIWATHIRTACTESSWLKIRWFESPVGSRTRTLTAAMISFGGVDVFRAASAFGLGGRLAAGGG